MSDRRPIYSSICATCRERATCQTAAELSAASDALSREIDVALCVPVTELRRHLVELAARIRAHLLAQDAAIAQLRGETTG